MKASDKPNGPAMASILACAIGVFVIGIATILAEASEAVGHALGWVEPVGPLSGETGLGVIVWLVAWIVLNSTYKGKNVNADGIARWSWTLIILGLLLTFPPVVGLVVR